MASYGEFMKDELDKKVISLIQGDLPVDQRPFAVMAEQIGITEAQFIERVQNLKKQGIIRRFGATLRHQEAGFRSNAMVAWLVPDHRIDEVGEILARFREVTHCYQRKPQNDWPYNLYTMIHGNNRNQCYQIAQQMSLSTGIDKYELLFSEKEFRKISMEYF
jgi:DNA-binding Lrp family transcriptional regulator